ncbi:hypothetical protein ES703_55773 [subsurface metagenome]
MPDPVYTRVKQLADRRGLTVSEWCKAALIWAAGILPGGQVRSHQKKPEKPEKRG